MDAGLRRHDDKSAFAGMTIEDDAPYFTLPRTASLSRCEIRARTPGPPNLMRIVRRRLTVQGILFLDLQDMGPDFELDMPRWIKEGRVKWHETVFEGIEKAPDAFLGLFSGANLGKMIVRLGPDR
jgi:NADPH-dependent curcumin reductase CurA